MVDTGAVAPVGTNSDSVVCDGCGTKNGPERRFCRRCGDWLITPPPITSAPRVPLGRRLRKWFLGRAPFGSGLSRVVVAVWVTAVMLPLVLLAGLTVAGKVQPDRWAKDQVAQGFGLGRVQGFPEGRASGTQGRVDWAVDGLRNSAWKVPWTGKPETLVIEFPKEVDLREIGFESGYADNDPTTVRPKEVQVIWSHGSETFSLEDSPDLQRRDLDAQTNRITIEVTEVFGASAGKELAIGDITFWAR